MALIDKMYPDNSNLENTLRMPLYFSNFGWKLGNYTQHFLSLFIKTFLFLLYSYQVVRFLSACKRLVMYDPHTH